MTQNIPNKIGTLQVGSCIARSFSILFKNFPIFFSVSILVSLPEIITSWVFSKPASGMVLGFLPKILLEGICVAVTFQSLRGKNISIRAELPRVLGTFLPLLSIRLIIFLVLLLSMAGAGLLVGFTVASDNLLAMLLAAVLSVGVMVGFTYFVLPWAVSGAVAVIEQTKTMDSIRRSTILTKGFRRRILATTSVMLLLSFLSVLAIAVPMELLLGEHSFISSTSTTVLVSIMQSLIAIVATVIYYDLRTLQEGLDVEHLAEVFD